ncbi:MAG: hypothetical protein RQ745_12780 [Longimicrobiales bacterium]|nr:hypothetical protein [Longimicrobiales bacterium]
MASLNLPSHVLTTEEWDDVAFSVVDDETLVLWSCSGGVAAVAIRGEDGQFERVPPTPYVEKYDLFRLSSAVADRSEL